MTDTDKTRIEKRTAESFLRANHTNPNFMASFYSPDGIPLSLKERVIKAMDEYATQEVAAYKEKLKHVRNKAIDECISDLKNKVTKTSLTWKLADELESLKSKPE